MPVEIVGCRIETASDVGPLTWNRLPRETEQQWHYFSSWLAMRPRSIVGLARQCGLKSHGHLSEIRAANDWDIRTRDHDAWLEEKARERAVSALAASKIDAAQAVASYISALLVEAQRHLEHVASGSGGGNTTAESVAMLEKLVKTRALLAGESTENLAVRGQVDHGIDLDALTPDELITLSGLLSKGGRER